MRRRQFLTYLTAPACLGPVACMFSGCGTLFHGDRVGQPHTSHLDWKIVALDGLGLLIFFVPGVAAFAVDFYTGAIYLPHDEYYPPRHMQSPGFEEHPDWGQSASPGVPTPAPPTAGPMLQPAGSVSQVSPASNSPQGLRRVQIPRDQLSPQVIEQVASQHVGRQVSLEDQQARISVLPQLDSFHEQRQHHQTDRKFGFAVRNFFARFQNA